MIATHYYSQTINPDANKAVGDFVSVIMFGEKGKVKDYCSLAVHKDGQLIAGVLYHDYYEPFGTVEISICAIDKIWMTRKVMHDIFALPFNMLNCQLVIMRTSEKNGSVRGLAEKYNLPSVYLPRARGRNEGELIYSVTEEMWRDSPFARNLLNESSIGTRSS